MKQDIKRLPDTKFLMDNMHLFRIHDSVALYNDDTVETKRTGDYINEKTNYYKDWNCNVALENLVITFDGTVKGSCNAELFEDYNINLFSETLHCETSVTILFLANSVSQKCLLKAPLSSIKGSASITITPAIFVLENFINNYFSDYYQFYYYL